MSFLNLQMRYNSLQQHEETEEMTKLLKAVSIRIPGKEQTR